MPNPYKKGLDELLDQLKKNPKIVKELIFEPNETAVLLNKLRSKAARRLISQPVRDFLDYVSDPNDGYPIAQCFKATKYLCAKGTLNGLCGGGTRTPPCKGGTRPCGGGTTPPCGVRTVICVARTRIR